ncbi:putative repeat protein (TIGR01451 family)/choice-of-anchor A domain-containing protein [Paenibacillus cellulosilyticus]|uniref:Putative repeat protein (TIGR01451 family)/choice-of-anchor A domain-containing protein n=1 Tax=Paenibacillus cellulosilyticus TaxID=375489 RepID=A0A2V2YUI9_9BACL|nr:choice-of-anchor A family protein [Paenibacillus cellulosilyticus]PWW04755.1 putative repeat protein (TIGR01451 family)/choice-of-anchor A domain-containing protein [Paenibacillus cellulosilyticus]QKS45880.1 choice-of-anchor A family protein [Paenibacillus cellulosilyticus]
MACIDLGIANDFNVFVFTDHTQSSVDSEGRVAVGGKATYTNYGVGSSLSVSQTRDDLVVQGEIDITSGANFAGNTIIYPNGTVTNYTMTNNNGVPNQPLVGSPIDFDAAQRELTALSLNLSAIPVNGTVENNFGQIVLTGTDPELNVFMFNGLNVDGEGLRLDTANGINIIAPLGSTIIITVGGENVGFGSYTIFRNGITSTRLDATLILWNFFQATTAFNQNLSITGSVLAPYADWEAIGFGNINGTIVANSLSNAGGTLEEHHVPFAGCLPGSETTTSTTTTTTSSTTSTTTTPVPTSTTSTTTTESTTSTTSSSTTSSATISTTSTSSTTSATSSTSSTTSSSTSSTTAPIIVGPNIIASKTANVTSVNIGDTITYTIQATNIGTAPGEAILSEEFPEQIKFIPSSLKINGGKFSGVDITEQVIIGTIAPGQTVTIEFQVFVAGFPPGGIILNNGSVVTVAPGTTPATCSPGVLALTGLPNVPSIPGQFLPVLPVVRPGFTPLPGELISLTPLVSASGKVLLAHPVTVPGVTIPPFLGLTIPLITGTLQPIELRTRITASRAPNVSAPNLIVFQPFLDFNLFIGQRITYSFFIVNNGNLPAVRTRFLNKVANNAMFIEGTVRVGDELRLTDDPNNGISLGPIPVNQGVIVRFDLLVNGGTSLTNSFSVAADFLTANNTITSATFQSKPITNPVQQLAVSNNARFLKVSSIRTVKVNGTYDYQFTITNLSPDIAAINSIFYDSLNPALEYVSGSLVINGVPQGDPQIGISLGTIAPGATVTLSFTVRVMFAPTGEIIDNQAILFFEFRTNISCFRGGLRSNLNQVTVIEEEEE